MVKTSMKLSRLVVILAAALAVGALPALVYLARSPVLIVTDAPFAALYGPDRMKKEQSAASRALFRRVRPVPVADGAGPDIVEIAITKASARPFCVLFPRRLSVAAERYHGQFPDIRSVIIGGTTPASELPAPDDSLFVYGTDRDTDLYRAGLLAGLLAGLKQAPPGEEGFPPQRTIVLWQDRFVTADQRDLFSRGAMERDGETAVVFIRGSGEMPEADTLSCVVLAGTGVDYLDRRPRSPVVFFSWLDPAMASPEIAVLFDDSPWGLAVPAAILAGKSQNQGQIPSKILILSDNIADNGIFRTLRKSAIKIP
ncbi:MAG: hypothetical protein FWG46_01875 [Treponema sp.]|nr:hypothetical protein [Treponema sp.]